jgi:type III restriction enzyme
VQLVDGQEKPIGKPAGLEVFQALVSKGILSTDGKIQAAFDPKKPGFSLQLPEKHKDLENSIVELMSSYQLERHIRREKDEGTNRLRKEIQLSPEFESLWNRIKPKTSYRVEFTTEELIGNAVKAIKRMEKIRPAAITFTTVGIEVKRSGVEAKMQGSKVEEIQYRGPLPDILGYLQNETELTRSTLVRILRESGRLAEFFVNPQRFMDAVASILKNELHRLLIDGIKYERIQGPGPEAEWEMMRFEEKEVINYLTALQVKKSIYEYVVYDSEIEREFARRLDEREDIRLFVKLPGWFKVDTPIGTYNPDWAILKHDDETLYLVRETKGTKDFLKLRNSEADKVRCGQKHFEAIGVPFAVAVTADEV